MLLRRLILIHKVVKQLRPQFAGLDPRQFRQVLAGAGATRAGAPIADTPLIERERNKHWLTQRKPPTSILMKSSPIGGFRFTKKEGAI